jgi:DNA-binding response OmpR family regulator
MFHAGQPIPISTLLEDVWDYPNGMGDGKTVRVAITRLRTKLEPHLEASPYIRNVRAQGYMIDG